MVNKNKKKISPFLRIVILVLVLLLIAVAATIGMFYYIFGITEPEGMSLASWPARFTDNFSVWMENDNGDIKIKETGLERLDEYGLWLQVIDETGREVFCHNKPVNYPVEYSASELVSLCTSTYEKGNTVFVNSYEDSGQTWTYLAGFPYAVGKHMLYYNGRNVERLSPLFRIVVSFILCSVLLSVVFYGFWLTRHLSKITKGIGNVLGRSYTPLPEKGVFGEIYGALNKMDAEICHSDKIQQDTERIRREWIANITHDLKTPLSPIRGYAELLMDSHASGSGAVQEYGGIILKNVKYTEKMINDLKLSYQLDSDAVPYHPQMVHIVRFLKELVIDIVNDPAFAGSSASFESNIQECEACIDTGLFRRAISNIIINALTHNPPGTEVTTTIDRDHEKNILICISDNGTGMGDEEQQELFNRYYRGTNTEEKPEGSGLGLAIAKQVITLHNGNIAVKSKFGEGTQFTIVLPLGK